MRIKAISLWQPWASLMAIGAKELETRSWATRYRGPLAIHAAKRWRIEQEDFFWREPYRSALAEAGFDNPNDLPLGCVLSVGNLVALYRTEKVRVRLQAAGRDDELAFGNYKDGRWAWHLEDMKALKKPLPQKGAQGLWYWKVPDRLVRQLGLEGVR